MDWRGINRKIAIQQGHEHTNKDRSNLFYKSDDEVTEILRNSQANKTSSLRSSTKKKGHNRTFDKEDIM